MKIYNKIVYDKYNNVIEEDSYDYYGPVAKADGDTVKQAVVVGAVAVGVGWVAGTLGTGPLASALANHMPKMLATFLASAGTTLVLSAVNRKFAPDMEMPSLGTSIEPSTTVTLKEPTQPYRVINGKTRVGGNIVFAETTDDNQYLHIVIVMAGHETNNISKIYFGESEVALETLSNDSNGIPIYTPTSSDTFYEKVRIKKHFGYDDQVADANLVADVTQWTTAHRLRGKTYMYVRLEFDSDVFPNGVPNITAEVEGKKVYDPRATSWTASSGTVNTSTNKITLTAHGLSTYDRWTYDSNSETAIGGLTNGTTYWVIKDDANTIQLATNYTNAKAGTAISLTSVTGSTTQKYNVTKYSSNPALCIRDYLMDTTWGLQCGTSEINDTNFQTAANTCDETVTLDSGTENRFTCNGSYQISQSPKNILENYLSSVVGNLVYSNGQFKLLPAVYQTPTVTLTEKHLRSGLDINTRVSKKELFNAVKGIYSEPANMYQPQDYPFLTSSTYETEDNGERNYADIDFPMTTSVHTVQRLAKIQLQKARQQITFTASFDMNAFQLDVGDTVQITNTRMGWSAKTFELTGWQFGSAPDSGGIPALLINAEFRETASAVYDYTSSDYSSITSGKTTNLPSGTSVNPPTAITITDELVAYNDGTVIVKLVINLSAPNNKFTELYEVELKQTKDKNGVAVSDTYKLIGRGARTKFEFLNVIDKAYYQVRARGVNLFGVNSTSLESSEYQVIGLTDPPSDVTNFACNIIDQDAFLSWDPVGDLDLSYYELRYQNVSSGADWGSSVPLVLKVSRPATSVVVPAKTGAYLIKARDKLGNPSINATVVYTAVDSIGDFNAVATSTQNPDWAGDKDDVVRIIKEDGTPALVLDTIELFDSGVGDFDDVTSHNFDGGTVDNNVESDGTYDFDAPIDLGASYKCQLTGELTQTVTSRDRLFDNVSGNFDAQTGPFDGDAESNCSSELQIATSADGVTYTSYSTFVVGDYTARYFKFRILMTSSDNSATPIITACSITIDMPDRIESANDITTLTTPYTVTFAKAFKAIPALGLAVQNLASGDKYDITSKSTTGFVIAFTTSAGVGVSRTFDWIAKGY